jgi:hypothetical protein
MILTLAHKKQERPNLALEPTAITRPRLNAHRYPDLLRALLEKK